MLPRLRSDNVAVALESKLDIEFSPIVGQKTSYDEVIVDIICCELIEKLDF
jgi:hypothetical protein